MDLPTFENLFFFSKHRKEIVKSGAISGWIDKDEFQIWSSYSLILEVQIITYTYLLSDYGNVDIFSQYVTQDVAAWFSVLPIDREGVNDERVNTYIYIFAREMKFDIW